MDGIDQGNRAWRGWMELARMHKEADRQRTPGLVSVIIPSYNKSAYIEATLDSVAAQTYPNIEIIVVDDRSSDESVALIQEWAATHSIPLKLHVHKENQGVCRTLNDGLALARGEYIACLAADDLYLPHKISSHVVLLEEYPDASFAYGDARVEDPDGTVIHESFTEAKLHGKFRSGDVFEALLRENFVVAPTGTIRGSSLDAVGPYDETLSYEDYDMWLRLARIGPVMCSETVDCVYLDAPGSMSKSLGRQVDIGHLLILSKHRHAPTIDKRNIDRLAMNYARRAAQVDSKGIAYHERLRDLARYSSMYGGRAFATQAIAEEVWSAKSDLPTRLRRAGSRLKQRVKAAGRT